MEYTPEDAENLYICGFNGIKGIHKEGICVPTETEDVRRSLLKSTHKAIQNTYQIIITISCSWLHEIECYSQ